MTQWLLHYVLNLQFFYINWFMIKLTPRRRRRKISRAADDKSWSARRRRRT